MDYFNYVLTKKQKKLNEGLTGLEWHEDELLLTEFSFLG